MMWLFDADLARRTTKTLYFCAINITACNRKLAVHLSNKTSCFKEKGVSVYVQKKLYIKWYNMQIVNNMKYDQPTPQLSHHRGVHF